MYTPRPPPEHSPTRALRRSQRGREGENEEREKNLATERRQDVKAVDGREQSGTLKNTHKKARRKDAEEEPEETEEGEEERKEAEEEEDEEGEEMDEEDEEKDEGESEREKAGGDEREDEGRRFRPTKALRNVLSEESVDFETLEKEAAAGQGGVHHAWEIDYSDLDPSGPFQQDFLKAHYRRNFRLHADDCGSEGFQVASLTARINYLTQHMIRHRKDLSCVRGLRALVVRRRKEDAASEVTRAFAASLKVARSHAALLEHTGAAPEPSEDRDDLRADGND
ncbi:putative ribosomal protein S15 [Neospora caninum Liverpool]|uniref:Putative ribosomal protein S15 n=1 Tax=Neospora caninum (strain Liverpool) TaxID=572307 RepID=F0VNZ5_NEOCL|nr:putative ribosomal protein S15 [Neospora caninum Liverpool]CBZ55441.1 putative ribosomal protein S15 [Neospora caninum Liverpool]|eukprot:XP_003885469.1 putative ribosomal protein S15 [Neospora caninum Liverpool]